MGDNFTAITCAPCISESEMKQLFQNRPCRVLMPGNIMSKVLIQSITGRDR